MLPHNYGLCQKCNLKPAIGAVYLDGNPYNVADNNKSYMCGKCADAYNNPVTPKPPREKRLCSLCSEKHYTNGFCRQHFNEHRRNARQAAKPKKRRPRKCKYCGKKFDDKEIIKMGQCVNCYERKRKAEIRKRNAMYRKAYNAGRRPL